jgi:aryl-alcohol dehydrogenase-like predicted oxidoreductase
MKRRHFLGTALAGATTLLAAREGMAAIPQGPGAAPDPFERVPLGKSGLVVSHVGAGSGMTGYMRRSNQTRLGEKKFRDLWRYAYDQGINYFDMADLYGTHPDIMPALKGVDREKFVLVSKIWWREGGLPETERLGADVLVDRFLREIGTDYLDLVHLHCVTDADWPQKLASQMDMLSKLKENGKIRAHGVSVHALPALEVAAEHPWVDSVHTRINPYGLKMDGSPEQVVPILEKMHANGKGVTGMKIIGEGQFANDPGKRDHSIRYVFGLECVDACIVGFERPEEIDDFRDRARAALASAPVP